MKPTAVLTAALLCALSPLSHAKPLKVFILAGQSNMEGQGSVDHGGAEGKGNLVWSMANSKSADKMKKLKNEKGEWVVRDDVRFRKAQEEGTKQIKNAVFVKTTDFARPPELSPCPTHGHHWFANAESYFLIGDACGEGMKSLLK
jgi:hypothetical protein